ncbi:hemolysin III family protein, partial [Enterococcus faecalis]|uniref:hemolysin III family protein n=1 Tax=Enterococcus faecalis TaxID=1351 RepID=UPI003D6AFBA6
CIFYKCLTLHKQETVKNISTIIYILLGWLCIIAARPLYESLRFTGTASLVAGVVSYTLDAAFYSLKNVQFMHVFLH